MGGPDGHRSEQRRDRLKVALDDRLPFDSAVRVGTLPNGLRYYVRRNTQPAKRVNLQLVDQCEEPLALWDFAGEYHILFMTATS
jgi:hypothetical protein